MGGLRDALSSIAFDQDLSAKYNKQERARLHRHYDELLKSVSRLVNRWQWYSKLGQRHTINTGRLIVPDQGYGAVVLDATASSNLVYQLFDTRAEIIPIPQNSRDYSNVTLHVSMGHRVGKNFLRDNAREEVSKLVTQLKKDLGGNRSHLSNLSIGRYSAHDIRTALGIPISSWKLLWAKLRERSSELHQRLADLGCRVQVEGQGRGARSYIMKG